MRTTKALLTVPLVLTIALAACGGDDDDAAPAGADDPTSAEEVARGYDSGGGNGTGGGDEGDAGDPIAGVDLTSLGTPPEAAPGTAVVAIDGTTTTFDGAALGVGQCEIGPDRIAVRIGQSGPWMAFSASPAGDEAWSAGPSWQPVEDPPQFEGLTPGSEIVVDGETVTYQGEVVIKHVVNDFDSWERTVGSLTVNCAAA